MYTMYWFSQKKFFLMDLLSSDSGQNVFPYCRITQTSILCAPICVSVYYFYCLLFQWLKDTSKQHD